MSGQEHAALESRLAIEFPCNVCGGHFRVSLGQILDAQEGMRTVCDARGPDECPGLFYAGLFDRKTAESLLRSWTELEREATARGGKIVLAPAEAAADENGQRSRGPDQSG